MHEDGPAARHVPVLRVLVAEDVGEAADMLGTILREDGHSVRVEYDGLGAAAAAILERFDVAILDIHMPLLNGWDVARELKARSPSTLLIAVSALSTPDDLVRSKAAGFDEHHQKPVSYFDLRDSLRAWALNRAKAATPPPV
ncbi:response regulator [Ramlibacter algicola]|uniref:Response regulator n=1 Tax=Ramlibacter algicola TaxID=2795217 RepID=A0A934URV4_9BURK|nr:response regulator [Ramlibacter algicola]MBK0392917.1 response regulator [Ramlibacter algicola]